MRGIRFKTHIYFFPYYIHSPQLYIILHDSSFRIIVRLLKNARCL